MVNYDKFILKELRQIPGVGASIAQDMYDMGICSIDELKGRDPDELYSSLIALRGRYIDRCMLYVFRCAVYFADNPGLTKSSLKWWEFKDK